MNPRNFFAELKRRNVYKVAVAYAVVAWLVVQIALTVLPTFHTPEWVLQTLVVVVALGFPLAVVLAWAFEITPEGIKRAEDVSLEESITHKTGRKLTVFTIVAMAVAIVLLLLHIYRAKPPAAGTGPSASNSKSIAVLPFANLSEDKGNAYFADGIQDEILARLSKIADLKVISRTSTQKYKSTPENLSAIAKELGVANMLEGSVQKAADQVRITVQLIRADSDSHLWAETYDRKLTDIFGVETEVAQRIAGSLEAKLTGREQHAIADVGSNKPEAYDAYLHALEFDNRVSNQDNERGIAFYRKAVELDPNFALAWAKLARNESIKYFLYDKTPEELARVEQAVEAAVRLQPDSSETYHARGSFYYFCKQDYDGALAELAQARQRAPNNALIIQLTGLVKRRQGKLDESLELQWQAANLDPRNPDIWANLGRTYRGMRRFKEAHESYARAVSVLPGDADLLTEQAELAVAEGNLEAAAQLMQGVRLEAAAQTIQFAGYFPFVLRHFDEAIALISAQLKQGEIPEGFARVRAKVRLGEAHLALGHTADAKAVLEEAKQELTSQLAKNGQTTSGFLVQIRAGLGERDEVAKEAEVVLQTKNKDQWIAPPDYSVARAYAMLGDADRAIPLLQKLLSVQDSVSLTPGWLRLDPVWDKIRNDRRFQKLANPQP